MIPRLASKSPKENCVNTLILALTHGCRQLSAPVVRWGDSLGCSGRASRRKRPVMGKEARQGIRAGRPAGSQGWSADQQGPGELPRLPSAPLTPSSASPSPASSPTLCVRPYPPQALWVQPLPPP